MYRMADVEKQLADGGIDAYFEPGPQGWWPDIPGRLIVASMTPGPGQGVDGTTDMTGLTLRVVGPQGDYVAAEDLAWAADRTIRRDESGPWGYRRVQSVRRNGGGPSLDQFDPHSGRTHFVTTYVVHAAAEVPGT